MHLLYFCLLLHILATHHRGESMGAHKKQRIFSILAILTMAVILACVFAACDKTDAQETNYKVTIHPNNGQADFVWEIKTDIPVIESNKKLNHENDRYINKEGLPQLRMYTDFNYECASLMKDVPWFPFTEPAAAVANSDKHNGKRRVVLLKAFYPHGLMNSFRCPKCARHSLYLGNQLEIKEVSKSIDYNKNEQLYKCMSCGTEISAKDFNVLVQSNFKERNSFLEETRIKMFCELESAEKLVFIGYSMPQDDIDYRTFFKSLNNVEKAYVVLHDKNSHDFKQISNGDDLSNYSDETKIAIGNYLSVFKHIYLNTHGFPDAADDILNII